MSFNQGGGLVDGLEKFKKKANTRRLEKAQAKLVRKGHHNFDQNLGTHPANAVNSEEFRSGWDRIFGTKGRDSIQDEDQGGDRKDPPDNRREGAAGGAPG